MFLLNFFKYIMFTSRWYAYNTNNVSCTTYFYKITPELRQLLKFVS